MAATLADGEHSSNVQQDTDAALRNILTNLYMLTAQAYDHQGSGTQQAMTEEIKGLVRNLLSLQQAAHRLPIHVPAELIQRLEQSRNPDTYTREFVEHTMKMNQQQKGRSEAYSTFRDILGQEMASAIPDIKDDVKKVVGATGGFLEV